MREHAAPCLNGAARITTCGSWLLNLTQKRCRKRGLFHTWGDDSLFRLGRLRLRRTESSGGVPSSGLALPVCPDKPTCSGSVGMLQRRRYDSVPLARDRPTTTASGAARPRIRSDALSAIIMVDALRLAEIMRSGPSRMVNDPLSPPVEFAR